MGLLLWLQEGWAGPEAFLGLCQHLERARYRACHNSEPGSEAGVAGSVLPPTGSWECSRRGLLGLLPSPLTSTSTALFSTFPIFFLAGPFAALQFPWSAEVCGGWGQRTWTPGRCGGGGAPLLHRLGEKFRFSSVLQAIRKGTGNYALTSKYISERNICFVQVSLVY